MTDVLRREGRTVLVVDDDRINRTMLTKLLEHEGYRASTAEDGKQALAALASEPFDAVLLDIVMPEVDGLEVLRTLKQDARLWHLPVIMISAVDEVDSIVACLELGAEDYVQKPFDPVLLRARLNSCLARRRFHALELEYQRVVEEQAAELEDLRRGLASQAGAGTAAAPAGERPTARRARAAVLAARVVGAGDLAPVAEPGDALAALAAFSAAVDRLAARFDGAVAGRDLDAATVVFESADGPLAALGMAAALGDELEPRLAGWNERHGSALAWGAAVGTGELALGAGDGDGRPVAVAGTAVDRARTLAAVAAGDVLMDEATFAAAGGPAVAEPVPGGAPGGAAGGPAYRLVAAPPPPAAAG